MNSPAVTNALTVDAMKRIEAVCTKFEESADPSREQIPGLLRDTQGLERSTLLHELVKLDVELRQQRGEHPKNSDYEEFAQLIDGSLVYENLLGPESLSQPRLALNGSQFDFLSIIGTGGIGVVWRVYDRKNERHLALKLLRDEYSADPVARSRLQFEGLLTGTLQHPGIPPVYERGLSADGTPYFAMKLVDGQTLDQILSELHRKQRDTTETLGIFEQVVQTLAYAHSQSVIHRDIKPNNIMVGKFGEVQVMDWGLAKRFGDENNDADSVFSSANRTDTTVRQSPEENCLTTVGDIVGTPGYMSPEQARGEPTSHDPRSDVFGLGAILFEILMGQRLYPKSSRTEIVERTKAGELDAPLSKLNSCDADADLVDLCRQCLSALPEHRPADARVVADATRKYLAGIETRLRQSELEKLNFQTRRTEERKRQRWIIGLSSLTAAIAVVGALAVANQWQRAKTSERKERTARVVAESEATTVHEINDVLIGIFSSTRPDKFGFNVTLREVIGEALPKLDGKFGDKPFVEGVIRRTLGESYRWLGDYDVAERQFRQSIEALERMSPPPELELLKSKARLASMQCARGRSADRPEAEELATEVAQRRRVLLGALHEETIAANAELAAILKAAGKLDQSFDLTNETLQLIDENPELETAKTVDLMMILADLQKRKGNLSDAILSYQTLMTELSLSETQRLQVLTQLGEVHDWKNNNERAADILLEAYRGRERHLGPMHRDTLSSLRKFTRTMDELRRYDENIAFLTTSLDRHVVRDGQVGMSVYQATKMMANALAGTGRTQNAIELLQEKVKTFRLGLGADHEYAIELKEQLDQLQANPASSR